MKAVSEKSTPRGLFRSTAVFASMTALSRVLGLVRDVVIASFFGAMAGADAFYVAFKIPNFMRRLFAEGAFSQAFVPLLAECQINEDKAAVRRMVASVSGVLAFTLFVVVVIAIIISPWLVRVFAPGFDITGERYVLTTNLLRITFPYLLMISMVACVAAVLNTYGSFGPPAFVPVLLNVSLIAGAYYAIHTTGGLGVYALAWAVCIAGVIQFLFLLPFLARLKLLVRPRCRLNDPAVRQVLRLMLPALLGASVAQINLLIDTVFASFLPVGSISWLYYASRLMNFPLGIFGVALGTVVLPSLSSEFAKQNQQRYSGIIDWGMRSVMVIGVPAALGLMLLAKPIIQAIFHYGAFNAFDVVNTSHALIAFALGIPAYMMIKVLVSAFYARKQMRTPVYIAIIALIANIVLSLLLMPIMHHVGLALSMTLSGYFNATALVICLVIRGFYQPQLKQWLIYIGQLTVACLVMVASVVGAQHYWPSSWTNQFVFLFVVISIACIIYALALALMGLRVKTFRQAPEQEGVSCD